MSTTYGVFMRNGVNFSHDTAESISYSKTIASVAVSNVHDALDQVVDSYALNTTATTASAGLMPALGTSTTKYLRNDGTWNAPNNTTYAVMTSGTTGLVPSGGTSDKYLKGNATWDVPENTTYDVFTSVVKGLAPTGGTSTKYLRGDATWQTTAAINTTYGTVTTATDGLMLSSDKAKLDNYPDKGSDTTKFLRNDGQWAVPPNTTYANVSTAAAGLAPKVTNTANFLKGDGTWAVPTNTTYAIMTSGTTGIVPSGGTSAKYLRGDATWQTPDNTTYAVMSSGTTGLVPSGGTNTKYLRGDASWEVPTNTTYAVMSSGTTGLVPSGGTNAKYLRGDATWQTTAAFNTTYAVMSSGTTGLVPTGGTSTKYLRGDATWQTTATFNTTYGTVTTASAGLLSAADKITINSLKSAAFKDVTNTYSASGTDPVSGQAVAEALSQLPEPMKFKGTVGTGGTVTALPVDGSAAVGDTYKVITDGTYAGQAARVGDTFICETKTLSANTWTYIPSGDEPGGTVTNVTIKATSPIVVDTTAAITSSGTRTLSHANSGATAGSYGDSAAQTPGYGGTFKVPYVTVNATGHVTGISEHTVTIPASDNTDVSVTQTATTTNADYEVLFSESANNTTNTEGARKNSNLKFNPSSGNLQTTQINGVAVGNSPKFTDTTYANVSTAAAGLAPKVTNTSNFLKGDGTWAVPTNTTYAVMSSGTTGLVPSGGTNAKYLRGDATWQTTAAINTTYAVATTAANGLMSSTDKTKLDNYPTKGTDTTKYLRNDGQWAVPPDTTYGVFTTAANGLTPSGGTSAKYLRGDATWQTTAAFNTTYGTVTTVANGLMSSTDKIKLNSYPDQGTDTTKYLRNDGQWAVPPDNNTTYAVMTSGTTGLVPSGGTNAKYLRGDATWQTTASFNTTYAVMTSGTTGLVPSGGTNAKYLRGDATWQTPTNTTYGVMSSGTTGLVPSGGTSAKYLRGDATWQTPTDTKNTAGSIDTSSKIFLIGATSQGANPQTYSDDEIFATDGVLTTKKVQIGGTSAATIQYNSTNQCIEFVFA